MGKKTEISRRFESWRPWDLRLLMFFIIIIITVIVNFPTQFDQIFCSVLTTTTNPFMETI